MGGLGGVHMTRNGRWPLQAECLLKEAEGAERGGEVQSDNRKELNPASHRVSLKEDPEIQKRRTRLSLDFSWIAAL